MAITQNRGWLLTPVCGTRGARLGPNRDQADSAVGPVTVTYSGMARPIFRKFIAEYCGAGRILDVPEMFLLALDPTSRLWGREIGFHGAVSMEQPYFERAAFISGIGVPQEVRLLG